MVRRLLFFTAYCCLANVYSLPRELFEGSRCHNDDSPGTCKTVPSCPPALEAIHSRGRHDLTRCGFDRFTEIVCCPPDTRGAVVTDPSVEPRPGVLRKSQKMCQTYAKQTPIIVNYQILGGEDVEEGEFPHMVALGFYSDADAAYRFDCGGTLISHRYVVTAAHCLLNVQGNELKICRMGVVNVAATVKRPDPALDHDVENVTIHREYKWKEKFNDIALVKLRKRVTFSDRIRPACLYTKNDDPDNLIVTGWGVDKIAGERVDTLQKATLSPVPLDECNASYVARTKRNVIKTQICAADSKSDTCQGDSGGPLQILTNNTLATIVGITSYGIACGSKYPGVYTRINSYLDWIEGIVWP